jgi:multidrug efflux pump subunit AcrA (membrane-fusion protein)
MQTIDTHDINSQRNSWFKRIALAALVLGILVAGFWIITRRSPKPPPAPHDSMAAMGGMASPPNSPPDDVSGASTELQIDLTPEDLKKAKIRTARVTNGVTAATLRVPGIVKANEYREVHVTPLVGGIVKEVPAVLGDHVKRGQPLAVIFSSDLAEAETQYVSYVAELDAEHKKLERTQNLLKLGAASQQEVEEVAATHAAHESHVRAALEKLKLLGASDHQIAALKQAEQINPNLVVPAPINGIVLTRNANLGLVATTAQELFTVADLSTVWVMASVNEKDFASVRVGSQASITAQAIRRVSGKDTSPTFNRRWTPRRERHKRASRLQIPARVCALKCTSTWSPRLQVVPVPSCPKQRCNPSANGNSCFCRSKIVTGVFSCARYAWAPQRTATTPYSKA